MATRATSASKYPQQLHIVHNVVGDVEISMLQQFLTHDGKSLLTHLQFKSYLRFHLKGSYCKTYSDFNNTWQLPVKNSSHRLREREFIGTNIKQFHAKIKLRRWDTEKNLQNGLSRRAPLEVS